MLMIDINTTAYQHYRNIKVVVNMIDDYCLMICLYENSKGLKIDGLLRKRQVKVKIIDVWSAGSNDCTFNMT